MGNIVKIEVGELKYEGEFPDCECGGKILPIIKQHEYPVGYNHYDCKPELLWKCNKCKEEVKVI